MKGKLIKFGSRWAYKNQRYESGLQNQINCIASGASEASRRIDPIQ